MIILSQSIKNIFLPINFIKIWFALQSQNIIFNTKLGQNPHCAIFDEWNHRNHQNLYHIYHRIQNIIQQSTITLLRAFPQNPWLTIENPSKEQTNRKFIRVRANDYWGNPKPPKEKLRTTNE